MKLFLFCIILFSFIFDVVYPLRIGDLVGLTAPNIAIYSVGMVLVVSAALKGDLGRKNLPGVGFALAVTLGVILSLIYAHYNGVVDVPFMDNARKAKTLVFEPALLYVSAFLLVDNREQGQRYLLIVVIVLGILNLVSVISQDLGLELFRVARHYVVEDVSRERFSGFSGNPNKTAYLICVLVVFQYYFFRQPVKGFVKAMLFTVMMAELAIIILSGSRGGLLVLVISILYLAMKLKDRRLIYGIFVVVPILMGVLLVYMPTLLENAATRMVSTTSGNLYLATSGRELIWTSLLSEFKESILGMLFGSGFGAAESMGIEANAHNLYLEVLIEFGIIGLGLFIYFLGSTVQYVRRCIVDDEALRYSVLAVAYLIAVAWIFSTIIGVMELITFTWGLSLATLLSPGKQNTVGAGSLPAATKHAAGRYRGLVQ